MNKLFKNIGKKLVRVSGALSVTVQLWDLLTVPLLAMAQVEVADSVAYYNVDKQAVAVGTGEQM